MKKAMNVLVTSTCFAVFLASLSARAEASRSIEFGQVHTVQGTLTISRVVVDGAGGKNTATLNGKIILEDSVHTALFIAAAYPDRDAARLILLEMDAGENACPVSYKVLEIKPDGGTNITREIGNCNDLASARYENNAWRIDIPKNGGASSDAWLYSDGKVAEAPRQERAARTVPLSPATKGEAISEDEARAFVQQWLRLSEKNEDLPAVIGLYADDVDFYKLGRVKKGVIEEDKSKYFGRWPKREHTVKSITLLGAGSSGERTIAVQFHYILTGSRKTIQGDANTIMALRREKGVILIISEKELDMK
ncbi:MAG: hypothetical protein AABZ10_05515 [Nitrospirota bacterium]